jgi:hypothetical protein
MTFGSRGTIRRTGKIGSFGAAGDCLTTYDKSVVIPSVGAV